jgi:hypothetical protein
VLPAPMARVVALAHAVFESRCALLLMEAGTVPGDERPAMAGRVGGTRNRPLSLADVPALKLQYDNQSTVIKFSRCA